MKNYYDNFTVNSLFNITMLRELTTYLMKSTDYVLNTNQKDIIFKDKFIIQDTPNKLYRKICELGISDRFVLFSPPKRSPIPEVLTFRSLIIDTEQLVAHSSQMGGVINSFFEYKNKSIIHLTPYIKTDMSFSDQTEFQYVVIRDVLSSSFFKQTDNMWLLPILKIVAKLYSITLSKSIASMDNLNIQEQSILNSLFLYYFLTICSNTTSAKNMMTKLNDYFFIPPTPQLESMFSIIENTTKTKEFNKLFYIFDVVPKLLPERVKLNYSVLVSKNQKLSNDTVSSIISMEYPPYFVQNIISSISGVKNGLSYVLKNILSNKEQDELIRYFSTNPSFLKNFE